MLDYTRDDGLGILRKLSGPQIERVRKEIIKTFKECRLSITTRTSLKVILFLDIELDLINLIPIEHIQNGTITQCTSI